MKIEDLLKELGGKFYTGVPDSQLKELCNFLMRTRGIGSEHIIAANEGNCVGIAAGHYLATGEVPVVYMQNSGLGNIVNPVASLLNPKVYGIPCIFIVGWRGEPGVHDEPQHVFQGEITETLLADLDIAHIVIDKDISIEQIREVQKDFRQRLDNGESVAFLVKKGALETEEKVAYGNDYSLIREEVIEEIVKSAGEDVIVSTTGKASRELFEIRERRNEGHEKDFLTVGSMGHSSSIAYGIAKNKPNTRVWCIDGDGAVLMHMGSMALLGSSKRSNMVHIVINNEAHETVGGMPTVAGKINLQKIAEGCGYEGIYLVKDKETLGAVLDKVKNAKELSFVEIRCKLYSRKDLGRPTRTARENKEDFMNHLKKCQ